MLVYLGCICLYYLVSYKPSYKNNKYTRILENRPLDGRHSLETLNLRCLLFVEALLGIQDIRPLKVTTTLTCFYLALQLLHLSLVTLFTSRNKNINTVWAHLCTLRSHAIQTVLVSASYKNFSVVLNIDFSALPSQRSGFTCYTTRLTTSR